MSALSIQVPFPVFQDRDGQPLENGYIWIGEPNLNPQTNPVVAYFDAALTIVAPQPLRTLNGYVSRAGAPAQIYVDGVNFSILVQDSKGSMVYNFPDGTGISPDACGVTYNPPFAGAVPTPVCQELAQTVSVFNFLPQDQIALVLARNFASQNATVVTAAFQSAINTGLKAIAPAGGYRVNTSVVVGADKALHLEKGVDIFGDMASPMPVIRVAGNFATLTGDGWPVVRTDHQTGWLPSSLNEGVINIGPAVTSGAANINWAMVDGIRVQGNASVYSQYAAGTNTDIDKYVGIKMVHGRYVYGSASTSLYNSTVRNCMIREVGVGVDMDPVVQGNNFINNYFYRVSFAGYRTRGCGENSYSHGFFHTSPGISFFRFESAPLRLSSIVGTFVANDVVTGASSGATLTLFPNFPFDQTEGAIYGVDVGAFIPGESLTGSISGATAVVSTTRQQYVDGSLGRTSLGNTAIGIIGEPGATAAIGTQNAGPIGGRHSRFYTILDANIGNYFQGRGNTGHGVLDYAGSNVLVEQGTIVSDRPATFTNLTADSVKIDSTVSGWKSAIGDVTNLVIVPHEIVALNKKRYVFDCNPVRVGQNMRLTFSTLASANRACMIKVRVAGGWFASSTSSRHIAAEYIFRISSTNSGSASIEGPTPVFQYGFDYTTDFTFTSAGAGVFTVDLLNPIGDALALSSYYFEVEILGPNCLLNTITLV